MSLIGSLCRTNIAATDGHGTAAQIDSAAIFCRRAVGNGCHTGHGKGTGCHVDCTAVGSEAIPDRTTGDFYQTIFVVHVNGCAVFHGILLICRIDSMQCAATHFEIAALSSTLQQELADNIAVCNICCSMTQLTAIGTALAAADGTGFNPAAMNLNDCSAAVAGAAALAAANRLGCQSTAVHCNIRLAACTVAAALTATDTAV